MNAESDLALSDLSVLDLTRAVAGPNCTRLLAEMGADVIKVEGAPDGDFSRKVSVYKNDRSLYFMQQNRGKKGLCINLKDPRGVALVAELALQADVIVENFRPGVMDAIGLGYASLAKLRPDVILCSISTFGQSGPLAEKPGYDFIAQAYSGITSMVGETGETPALIGAALGDASTGTHAALAILAAIHRRARCGKGDHLDVSILDTYYSYHDANVHTYSASDGDINPTRQGRHYGYVSPAGVFKAKDGYLVILGAMHHWPDMCRVMGREDLIDHPDFRTDPLRNPRRDEIATIVETWLAGVPDVATAIELLTACDVPCAPVLTIADTVHHPHLRERGTVRTVDDPVHGPIDIPGHPIRWKNHPNNIPLTAPTLGQHNEEIMRERLGRSSAEIEMLRAQGVLMQKPT